MYFRTAGLVLVAVGLGSGLIACSSASANVPSASASCVLKAHSSNGSPGTAYIAADITNGNCIRFDGYMGANVARVSSPAAGSKECSGLYVLGSWNVSVYNDGGAEANSLCQTLKFVKWPSSTN